MTQLWCERTEPRRAAGLASENRTRPVLQERLMAEVRELGGCRTNLQCFSAEMVTGGSRDRTGRDLQPGDPAWPPLASGGPVMGKSQTFPRLCFQNP